MSYNMLDCTFCIPVLIEHSNRLENIELLVEYILYNFNTNIIVGEQCDKKNVYHLEYLNKDVTYIKIRPMINGFYRTRILNILYRLSNTRVVINCDTDIFLPPESYYLAYNDILYNEYDVVYPYNGDFICIDRSLYSYIQTNMNVDFDDRLLKHKSKLMMNEPSFGGIIFFNRVSLINAGLENENFLSWGPEDQERYIRFKKLGYKINRIEKYPLYHLDHYRGDDSTGINKYFDDNLKEHKKVKGMCKKELLEYIKTWDWIENEVY